MTNIDFYTISHVNANKYYFLNKPPGYYNYYDIVDESHEVYNDDEEKKMLINQSQLEFDLIMNSRLRREKEIRSQFTKYNIKFIPHSFIIRNYIMYNKYPKEYVLSMIYRMKILFEYCNIKDKWEEYKSKVGNKFFTMETKDNFYNFMYKEFTENNPQYNVQF